MNTDLMRNINWDRVIELDFIEEQDGTNDPRGIDYNMRVGDFDLWIDAWFNVFVCRKDCDAIELNISTEHELINAIYLIGGEL